MITILAHNPTFSAAYNLRQAFGLWEETRLITLEAHPLWPGEDDVILTADNAAECQAMVEASRFTMIAGAAGLVDILDMLYPVKGNFVAFWGDTAYFQSATFYNNLADMLGAKVVFAMLDLMPKAPEGAVALCHPVRDFGYEADKSYPVQIMHSPRTERKRALKGTETIERVISQLKQEFPDLIYTTLLDLPWLDCLAQKRKAHIFIDQLPGEGMPAGLGRSGEEALAFGSVVITALHGEEYLTEAPPIVKAYNESELYNKLRLVLKLSPARLGDWGQSSRDWAERHLLYPAWLDYVERYL
jgi:hypothetical protein